MKRIAFGVLALALCATGVVHAQPLSVVRIVTPQYTLACVSHVKGKRLELDCAPSRTPSKVARTFFETYRYGDSIPYAILAQVSPLGNGGPSVGAGDNSITVSGGYNVSLNTANANTWSTTQTFSNIINNGLSANDACVGTNGSKQMVDGTCVSTSGATTFTNYLSNTYVPSAACATNAPTAPVCIGSPTSTVALAIGKVSGGWGGTTSSASGQIALCANTGSADRCGLISENSSGQLILSSAGSGNVVLSSSGSLVLSNNGLLNTGWITQNATGSFGGHCTASSSTCSITLAHTFTTAICFASDITAAAPVKPSLSGATLTLTSGTGSGTTDTLQGFCLGDPQ